jgi:hypothetical protein
MGTTEEKLKRALYCIANRCIPVEIADERENGWDCADLSDENICRRCMLRYVEKGD